MSESNITENSLIKRSFSLHGWVGLTLILVFWTVNWLAPGQRTTWAFFPLWLGYALFMDALVLRRYGTSLLKRSRWGYISLFLISAPGWWLFEALNLAGKNWTYLGVDVYTPLEFFLLATVNFSVVIPAVFGAAEWFSGMGFIRSLGRGPRICPDRPTTWTFFVLGWVMLALLLVWPRYFFPFTWLAPLFILEPLNVWMGNRSLSEYTARGDWRPLVSLFCGVLFTGLFWEMWNYFSYPKWVYDVPFVGFGKVFEMPILGYTGYLPFSLELFSLYHFIVGLFGRKNTRYIHLDPDETPT